MHKNTKLLKKMTDYDCGDPKRIQHFIKVHEFSMLIAELENVDYDTMVCLEAAAILHDIGIHKSEEKYGSCIGKYQEMEGPAEAENLLNEVGEYTDEQIDRIKYLIGHHHTYNNIDGIDYQILVEADFLVNFYEDNVSLNVIKNTKNKIFKTKSGIDILDKIYLINENS